MLSSDPRAMNLLALGMAKITYGALTILRRHLGNDLELAQIGFAVVMRTRRDWFQVVESNGLTADTLLKMASHRGYYTSVNEIHQYTSINRASVRRKLNKLKELGIVEKIDDDKWHLVDLKHGIEEMPAVMLRDLLHNYVTVTNKLEEVLPEEIRPIMRAALSDLDYIEAKALDDEEVEKKIKRGLEVRH